MNNDAPCDFAFKSADMCLTRHLCTFVTAIVGSSYRHFDSIKRLPIKPKLFQ